MPSLATFHIDNFFFFLAPIVSYLDTQVRHFAQKLETLPYKTVYIADSHQTEC